MTEKKSTNPGNGVEAHLLEGRYVVFKPKNSKESWLGVIAHTDGLYVYVWRWYDKPGHWSEAPEPIAESDLRLVSRLTHSVGPARTRQDVLSAIAWRRQDVDI